MYDCNLKKNDIGDQTFQMMLRSMCWVNVHFLNKTKKNKQISLSKKKFFILYLISTNTANTIKSFEIAFSASSSSLSILISKMVEEGLLEKSFPEKGDDGRKVYFTITDKGIQEMSFFYSNIVKDINSFFDSLNEEQQEYYSKAIFYMNKVFQPEKEEL